MVSADGEIAETSGHCLLLVAFCLDCHLQFFLLPCSAPPRRPKDVPWTSGENPDKTGLPESESGPHLHSWSNIQCNSTRSIISSKPVPQIKRDFEQLRPETCHYLTLSRTQVEFYSSTIKSLREVHVQGFSHHTAYAFILRYQVLLG